jgi:hypothetical protein
MAGNEFARIQCTIPMISAPIIRIATPKANRTTMISNLVAPGKPELGKTVEEYQRFTACRPGKHDV